MLKFNFLIIANNSIKWVLKTALIIFFLNIQSITVTELNVSIKVKRKNEFFEFNFHGYPFQQVICQTLGFKLIITK